MSIQKLSALILVALPLVGCSTSQSTRKADSLSSATAPVPPPSAVPVTDTLPAAAGSPVARADEYNGLKTGWPLARFNAALGEQLTPKYDVSDECTFLRPASFPPGVMAMVVLDTIVRFDIVRAGVLTAQGAGVGDTEARIKELYAGTVEVQPHKYTGPVGHYLIVSPPGDTLHRIIFETDGQKVLRYRVGNRPAVEYIEGCA